MDKGCTKVLNYMKTYKTITTYEAFKYCGVSRLSARIWDLRNKYGYDIGTQPRKVRTADGDLTSVNAYFLEESNGDKANSMY